MRAYVENSNGDTRELEETLECPCDVDRMRYEDYFNKTQQSIVFTVHDEEDNGWDIQIDLDMVSGQWFDHSMALDQWNKIED